MRHPDLPSTSQRMQAAKLAGEVQRLIFTEGIDDDTALARIREITTDAYVLGHELGSCLVHEERSSRYTPTVRWLRAAGADRKQAELKADWLREEIAAGRHLI